MIEVQIGNPTVTIDKAMPTKRILITLEGGVIQNIETPDDLEDVEVIIRAVDDEETYFYPVTEGITAEWQHWRKVAIDSKDPDNAGR